MSHTPRLLCIAVLLFHATACLASDATSMAASPCYPDDCMNETVTLEAAGLFTNPNPVGGRVPDGAMLRAVNVVSDAPGRVTPRRGMKAFDYALAASSPPTGRSAFFYGDTLMVHTSASSMVRDTGSAFTPVLNVSGSSAAVLPPLMGGRVHATSASGKLYVNTQTGVQELDGVTGVLKTPGAPRALDPVTFQSNGITGTVGFLPHLHSVAYRVVIGFNDTAGRPVLGEPSGRFVVLNEDVNQISRSVRVNWTVPIGVTATSGHFIQLYRTATATPGVDPGDIMAQVYERPIGAADIAAKYIAITDDVPDFMRQGPLYTNGTQGGIAQANVRPTLARDIATFRTSTFLANIRGPNRLTIRLLARPASDDVLTIGGRTFTAKAGTANAFNGEFNLGTGTVSQQLARTAYSLVTAINVDTRPGATLTARYGSGDADAPGIIVIEERVPSPTPFTAVANLNGDRYVPELVAPASSVADVRPNRLHFSKAELPYAFPLGNTIPVGSEDSEILRIVALRDSLYIFKKGTGEGKGLWRLNGSGPGAFYVTQVNASLDLIASESLAVVDNQILGLSSSGIFAVSESGVEFISPPIENLVRDIIVGASGALESVAHGVGYESTTERKYFLWVPDSSDDTLPAFAFVYNLNTETWTTRDDSPSCAVVGGVGKKLHTCVGTTMHAERRTGTVQDYMGPRSVTATATASTASGVVTSSPGSFSVDMAVWTTGSGEANARRVVAVNATTGELTLSGPLTGGTFPQSLFGAPGIAVDIAWTMNSAGAPTAQKQFFDAALLFSEKSTATWGFHFQIDGMESGEWESTLGYAEGTPYCRAEVPWSVQRTTRITTRATRSVAVEKVDILGMRSNFNVYRGTLDL